jgi:hypothetical protein
MKQALKALTGLLFLPFIILGGIIAVVKTLFVITFGLSWQKGDDWHGYLLMQLDGFMKWLQSKN